MNEWISDAGIVGLVGLLGGVLLGLAARLGRFCTLGAIEDLYYGESSLRLRMWGIAIGVAVIGTFGLSMLGALDLTQTLYLGRGWNPLASIIGGLMFGYGMALAGNCGYGALARVGGGDLRSLLIVLIMGVFAYMALGGPLSSLRLAIFDAPDQNIQSQSYAHLLAQVSGMGVEISGMIIGAAILVLTLTHAKLRREPSYIFWGAVAGFAILTGWVGTQWVADHGFDATPVVSHTFSAPLGETIIYLMSSSGNSVSFGTGSVAGIVLGAFVGSLIKGHFRWEACDDPRELRRQIVGAALMGIGAVVAVGCSIGQGLSAFSVLALSAPITLFFILVGAAIGLRQLIVGFGPSV
ncbi:MAG: YeeE/YedE family protein [Ahrensia sp.]